MLQPATRKQWAAEETPQITLDGNLYRLAYQAHAQIDGASELEAYKIFFDRLLKNSKETITILDVGCGDGRFGSKVASLSGIEYTGIDVNESSLALARESYPEIHVTHESIFTLNSNLQFDCICVPGNLFSMFAPSLQIRFLKKLILHCKNGGYVLVDTMLPDSHGFGRDLEMEATGEEIGLNFPHWVWYPCKRTISGWLSSLEVSIEWLNYNFATRNGKQETHDLVVISHNKKKK